MDYPALMAELGMAQTMRPGDSVDGVFVTITVRESQYGKRPWLQLQGREVGISKPCVVEFARAGIQAGEAIRVTRYDDAPANGNNTHGRSQWTVERITAAPAPAPQQDPQPAPAPARPNRPAW